jgi:hypothetical protein
MIYCRSISIKQLKHHHPNSAMRLYGSLADHENSCGVYGVASTNIITPIFGTSGSPM